MKILCPKCGFEGSIKDDQIFHPGQTVGCPKCKERFLVETTTDDATEADTATQADAQADSIAPDREETSQTPVSDNSQPDEIEFPHPFSSEPPRKSAIWNTRLFKDKGFDATNMAILSIAILLALSIGFFAGRTTKTTPPIKPTAPKTVEKEIQKKIVTPEKVEEKQPIKDEKNLTPIPIPSPPKSNPGEDSGMIARGIDLENYVSDDYFNITEIDNRLKEWRESDLTDIQKEMDIKRYAETFLGKNLNGHFLIKEVRRRYFNNTYFSGVSDSFPDESFVYVIKAVSAEPVSEREHELSDVLIGMKETENIIATLNKGDEIYVEGIIYSWKTSGGTYDIYLVNCKLDLIN